jgi:hypothetical protein
MAIIASIVFALSWMCIPVNLYYLRNVYFADQCIISVVLFFILLEIYKEYFSVKHLLKYFYTGLKFIVSLYGVLTDYYFLFVLFVSWLVTIIPLIKSKENFKKIVLASLVYVLPVLLGLGAFFIQIIQVPNYSNIILNKMKYRISGNVDWEKSKIIGIIRNFLASYSFGWILIMLLVICIVVRIKHKSFLEKYSSLLNIMMIIYIPPVFQILVLQNHSVVHEFSMLKFALPIMLVIVILTVFMLDLKKISDASIIIHIENDDDMRKLKIPFLYLIIIVSSVFFSCVLNADKNYYLSRIGTKESYERENLIRSNYDFSDVYFSFTESIMANPPQYLAISQKLIYKVDSIHKILEKFPNLKPEARILLILNKDDSGKSWQIIWNERNALKKAHLLFSSENYAVYQLDKQNLD